MWRERCTLPFKRERRISGWWWGERLVAIWEAGVIHHLFFYWSSSMQASSTEDAGKSWQCFRESILMPVLRRKGEGRPLKSSVRQVHGWRNPEKKKNKILHKVSFVFRGEAPTNQKEVKTGQTLPEKWMANKWCSSSQWNGGCHHWFQGVFSAKRTSNSV